jgi:hypothetical protein
MKAPTSFDEPTYRCPICTDDPAGWISGLRCPDVTCGRFKAHGPHTFAVRCPCWLDRNAPALEQQRSDAIQSNRRPPAECEALDDLRAGRYRFAKPRAFWRAA